MSFLYTSGLKIRVRNSDLKTRSPERYHIDHRFFIRMYFLHGFNRLVNIFCIHRYLHFQLWLTADLAVGSDIRITSVKWTPVPRHRTHRHTRIIVSDMPRINFLQSLLYRCVGGRNISNLQYLKSMFGPPFTLRCLLL